MALVVAIAARCRPRMGSSWGPRSPFLLRGPGGAEMDNCRGDLTGTLGAMPVGTVNVGRSAGHRDPADDDDHHSADHRVRPADASSHHTSADSHTADDRSVGADQAGAPWAAAQASAPHSVERPVDWKSRMWHTS